MHLPTLLLTTLLTLTTTPFASAFGENPVVASTVGVPAPAPAPAPADPSATDMDCTTYETDSCGGGSAEHKGMILGRNTPSPNMNSIKCSRALRDHEQIDLSTHAGKRDLGDGEDGGEGDGDLEGVEGRNASEGVVGGGRIYAEFDDGGDRKGKGKGKGDQKGKGKGKGVEKRQEPACGQFVGSLHGDVGVCMKFPRKADCLNLRRDDR